MVQIITNNSWGGGWGGWASYTAWNWIEIQNNEISVDESVVQTTDNLATNLDSPDDTHYPSTKAVKDAISSAWGWDVSWPSSSTDGDVALFDGATWKLIKDSWVNLSSKLDATALSNDAYSSSWNGDSTHTPTKDALYDKIDAMDTEIWNKAADTSVVKLTWNQTINWTKTFWTSPVVPSKTSDATNTWTAIATEAQVYNVAEDVATINWKIPSAATSSNQLADKNYVNDSINSVTAYYITKNAQGDQFATYAELAAATTFYSWWVVRTPTRNDYTIVLDDETHNDEVTRYIYNSGWEYQYTINESPLTQAQLDALNSWITSWKVTSYDSVVSTISWYGNIVTHNTSEFATAAQWAKADTALQSGDNISELNNNAWYITDAYHDSTKQDTLVSGTNIKTINSNSILWSGNLDIDALPSQTGQSWKYLTTDWTTASWGNPNWIGTEDEYGALWSDKLTNWVYHWIYIDDEA